jgi:hypothetical protein
MTNFQRGGEHMKCRDCKFLSEPTTFKEGEYPKVRCTLGLWDEGGGEQWYSYGNCVLNRAAVRRFGDKCTRGEPKSKK